MWINLIILNVTILFSSQNTFQNSNLYCEKYLFLLFYYFFPYAKKRKNVLSIISGILAMVVYYVNGMVSNHANMAHLDLMMMMLLSLYCLVVCMGLDNNKNNDSRTIIQITWFYYCFSNTYSQFLCLKLYSSLHTNGFMRLHHTHLQMNAKLELL